MRNSSLNTDRMHCGKYMEDGLFICSSHVGSGCQTVLCARMKQSEMLWSLKGAKGMIPISHIREIGTALRILQLPTASSSAGRQLYCMTNTGKVVVPSGYAMNDILNSLFDSEDWVVL